VYNCHQRKENEEREEEEETSERRGGGRRRRGKITVEGFRVEGFFASRFSNAKNEKTVQDCCFIFCK